MFEVCSEVMITYKTGEEVDFLQFCIDSVIYHTATPSYNQTFSSSHTIHLVSAEIYNFLPFIKNL